MTYQTFIQRASGDAILQVVPGTKHCSITEPSIHIRYHIAITYCTSALDEDGFLIEATAFKGYFTGLGANPISLSCERLSKKICMDFMDMLGDRKSKVLDCSVVLEPFPGVSVEYKASKDA